MPSAFEPSNGHDEHTEFARSAVSANLTGTSPVAPICVNNGAQDTTEQFSPASQASQPSPQPRQPAGDLIPDTALSLDSLSSTEPHPPAAPVQIGSPTSHTSEPQIPSPQLNQTDGALPDFQQFAQSPLAAQVNSA